MKQLSVASENKKYACSNYVINLLSKVYTRFARECGCEKKTKQNWKLYTLTLDDGWRSISFSNDFCFCCCCLCKSRDFNHFTCAITLVCHLFISSVSAVNLNAAEILYASKCILFLIKQIKNARVPCILYMKNLNASAKGRNSTHT